MPRYQQGLFKPKNPQKYKGNPMNVVYRSSWELSVFRKLDTNSNVLQWSSEETVVPYRSPLDKKLHRYFVDVVFKKRGRDGVVSTLMVEIKPFDQTQQPTLAEGKKPTKSYYRKMTTFLVNQAKWEAATEYCKKRGWTFHVITEKELFGKNR